MLSAMALAAGDLVLCSGTLPRGVPFLERLRAASAAGFAGISLWGRDYRAARDEGLTDADIVAMLADHGLSVGELDPAWWWLPGALETGRSIPAAFDEQEVFAYGADDLFRLADLVGARSMNAVDVFGGGWSFEEAVASFAALCDQAAAHGLLVHIEFLPWSRFPDVASAWDVVRAADRANGGIAVDAWHYVFGGSTRESLRSVPGDRVLGVQLDDGPAVVEGDPVHATLHDRRLPGEGVFDLGTLMADLASMGVASPVGVEVFSDALHALEPAQAARRAAEASRLYVV
jgi:sugar phosphate isomerase/epimerase